MTIRGPSSRSLSTATDGCGNAVATTAIFVQVTSSDAAFYVRIDSDPLLVGADTVSVTQEGCSGHHYHHPAGALRTPSLS